MTRLKTLLLTLIPLAWLTAVLIGYVAGHKPFSAEELLVWLKALWQFSVAAAILTLAGGLGERILPAAPESLVRAAITAGVGLGVFSLVTLGVGLFLGAGAGFSTGVLLAAALLAGRNIPRWLKNFRALNCLAPAPPLFTFLLALILLLQLLTALAPPLAFDALVYHLALPQLALHTGRIAYTPDLMFAGMPQMAETLYLLALSLGGQSAATALGLLIGLLACLGLAGYAAQELLPTAA